MIHSVALVIADFFVSKDVITEEEKEVCAYGMELIISGIINVSLVIIIGLITCNIWYAIVYNIMMNTMGVYAGYSDSTSHHTYAGNTRFFYLLSMEDFAVYAYLSADDQSELSLIGYVEFSLLYDYDRYNFSASDQYGYNIEAATRTPYLTRYSCASYYVCSDTGSTTTNLNLKP